MHGSLDFFFFKYISTYHNNGKKFFWVPLASSVAPFLVTISARMTPLPFLQTTRRDVADFDRRG